jgi:hypothetical protein
MTTVLLVQAAATLFMTGVIWFVQIVHYPLMARVGTSGFPAYETDHARLTGYIVILPMTVELACAAYLLFKPPSPTLPISVIVGAVLVVVIWLSTFLLQVPQHNTLQHTFNPDAHSRLVSTNWIRTIAWTIRSVIVLYLLR